MPKEQQPTARRRLLGTELRALREKAGVAPRDVAARLGCDVTKISRMELGRSGVRRLDLETMLDLYRVEDRVKHEALFTLARESRKKMWWHRYGGILDPCTRDLLVFEAEARSIRSFDPVVIPALLQTEGYARALTLGAGPPEDEAVAEARVALRMERKRVFAQQRPPLVAAVVDESALRRTFGGPKVMADQLRHLAEVNRGPAATVLVVPHGAGAHPGVEGPFRLMSYPEGVGLETVFIRQRGGGVWLGDEAEVRRYRELMDRIRALALPVAESTALIEQVAEGLEQG